MSRCEATKGESTCRAMHSAGTPLASTPTEEENTMSDEQRHPVMASMRAAGYEPEVTNTGGGIWLVTAKLPDGRTVYVADEVDAFSIEATDGTGWNVAPTFGYDTGIRWLLDTIPMVAAIPDAVDAHYVTASFIAERY